ncbi:MAG: AAA family ATPase [Anaerolineaceae bacterium]|nr:AAA family ATPase [Anaerolineaceae bacterium]
MKLKYIKVQGFRSFCEPIKIDFCDLTMLIGNNDVGKSSILDIIEIVLTSNSQPDENDYYTCDVGENAKTIEVILAFDVTSEDKNALAFAIDQTIVYRAIYSWNNIVKEYLTEVPKDEDLREGFPSSAPEQKAIIEKYDHEALVTATNATLRTEWYEAFVKTVEKQEGWKTVPSNLQKIFPKIQRYGAMDYDKPENLINRTAKQIFETVLYEELEEEENGGRELKKSLRDIEIEAEQKINKKVTELKKHILKYASTVTSISYKPQIDFARGFQSGNFQVDEGRGEHLLNKSGDGTKRKIFMATTDWDREVTLSMQAEGGSLPDIIRAYDEPDTNLDYQAQHHLYRSIVDIVSGEDSNIQAIISTHSPRMIDRAPAQKIRMLKAGDGKTVVEKINTGDDAEVEAFLTNLSRELGITNTLMFYENCFILVEGETEENSLPLFYRTIYGNSLLEDGINIINVRGNGAFKEFLKLFSHNKQELVLVLMDQDCADSRDDKLTEEVLRNSGFTENFCKRCVLKVGRQEFEDLFSLGMLVKVYNDKWPKKNGNWVEIDFPEHDPPKKYSDGLKKIVWDNCDHDGNKWSKPELGTALGKFCEQNDIPTEIKDLFTRARKIANSNN